jgi:hypothetical protein
MSEEQKNNNKIFMQATVVTTTTKTKGKTRNMLENEQANIKQ